MSAVEVTSVGDINIDLITSNLRELPARDSQIIINDLVFSSGGCAANFAKAVSALGVSTRFIGKVGDDFYGEFLRNDFTGVDLQLSLGSRTGVTLALTFVDGCRSFITYPGSNGEFTLDDVDFNLIEGRFLHVGSFFLQGLREDTMKILEDAHSKNMITSFDTGWDPAGWQENDRKLVIDLLNEVDIFFPNYSEAKAITGLDDVDRICGNLLDYGLKIVALKLGDRGCLIVSGDEKIQVESFSVDAVDSTGAGDVFAAAFIYGQYMGWGLEESGRFASAAAALSTRYCGSTGYPTEKEVKDFM